MTKWLTLFLCLFAPAKASAAWASLGSAGTYSQNSSTAAWTIQIASPIATGEVLVLVVATDNDGNGTNNDDIGTITTSIGNMISLTENEEDPSSANAGAAVGVFWIWANSPIAQNSNITINLNGSRTAKAAIAWRFSVTTYVPGKVNIQTIIGAGSQFADIANGDETALTLGSLTNAEHLWICGIASETTNGSIATKTASWTVMGTATANTGTEATSMGVAAEFLIATGTTATSDPTMTDTTADRAGSMRAFDEALATFSKGQGATD